MTDTPGESAQTYQAIFDPAACERCWRAYARSQRKQWLTYAVTWYLSFLVAALVLLGLGALFADQPFPIIPLVALLFALSAARFMCRWTIDQQIATIQNTNKDQVFSCTLTDEAWTFTDKHGVTTSIPWKIMRFECETDDAWMIEYAGRYLPVFRQPLRDAGPEADFRERIVQKSPHGSI